MITRRVPDFELVLKCGGIVHVKRGLQAAEWRGGEGMERQAMMPWTQFFGLHIAKTDDVALHILNRF